LQCTPDRTAGLRRGKTTMQLTENEIGIIRQSYEWITPEVERVSENFYTDLFGRVPDARPLFRDDLSEQGMRFMSAISVIVENLDDQAALGAEIEKLAAGHAAFLIKPSWFREMQESLIDTFAHALGARFTNEVELAWRSVFSQICDRMEEKTGSRG